MNCEHIQPSLLDYSRKLLKGPEAEEIRRHLDNCPECAAVLKDESELSELLSSVPDEQPRNDVWALVRSRTRPRTIRPLVWLHSLVSTSARRAATAGIAAAAVFAFYATSNLKPPAPQPMVQNPPVVAVYSDDPLGGHTDAVIDSIDDM